MQNLLFIVNDSPYGGEKTFNALRFAINLQEDHGKEVNIKSVCFFGFYFKRYCGSKPK